MNRIMPNEDVENVQVDWNVWKKAIDEALSEIEWGVALDVCTSLKYNYSYFLGIKDDPELINELRLYLFVKDRVELLVGNFYSSEPVKTVEDKIGFWKIWQ